MEGPLSHADVKETALPRASNGSRNNSPHQYGNQGHVRVVQSRPKPQCWEHGCNGRQFSSFSSLLRHQRQRSGDFEASCPDCGAKFNRVSARNEFGLDYVNPLATNDVLNDFDFDSFLHDNEGDAGGFDFSSAAANFMDPDSEVETETSTVEQQHGGIRAAIQRVASHLDPNAPIRLQPSPVYYPPPADGGGLMDPASARAGERSS
ncbi:hypothetical protein INS49_007440 [Diaporthe citri]|uniref:uncharacterized protein n=1 Tax=Diaporthe citri TaxID=83186 RepID=UPI001C8124D1|nr:uncharacterized protein INS49_007440 [Diaporthe citri]KAG6353360.1 hypothetical protein INS49_007440 [Diaporthe citri]